MLEKLSGIDADPILGLMAAYQADPNPNKIDLGVGVYKNEMGDTPVLPSVKLAENKKYSLEKTKTYISPLGSQKYVQSMAELAFGHQHSALIDNRICTMSTPGGTGALRAAAEIIKRANPSATLWLSDPSWGNHAPIFEAVGLKVKYYPYYDYDNHRIKFAEMINQLKQLTADDVVLLHACCHNPCGADLSQEQWQQVANTLKSTESLPLIDMAYQGFATGVNEDAYGVKLLASELDNLLVCQSCSKNFGLYRERTGACSIVTKSSQVSKNVLSQALHAVRAIYSMPPAHGAGIVELILEDSELTSQWLEEVAEMRARLKQNRQLLANKLNQQQKKRDFSFIATESGMFSFLGLSSQQVNQLKDDYSVYMVDSGRISLAGINSKNIDYLIHAICAVL